VFVGAWPARSDEGSEVALVDPNVFVAVTTTRNFPPRSAVAGV